MSRDKVTTIPHTRLTEKLQRRYESNLRRSINALDEIVKEAPVLLIALESGHKYRSVDIDNLFLNAEKLRTSYIHVVECYNFLRELEWLTDKESLYDERRPQNLKKGT